MCQRHSDVQLWNYFLTINSDSTHQNWIKFAFIVTCSIFLQSYWVSDNVYFNLSNWGPFSRKNNYEIAKSFCKMKVYLLFLTLWRAKLLIIQIINDVSFLETTRKVISMNIVLHINVNLKILARIFFISEAI